MKLKILSIASIFVMFFSCNNQISIDKTKTFVKYKVTEVTESFETYYINDDDTYTTHSNAAGIYGRPEVYDNQTEYTHEEFLNVLTSSLWHGGGI